jgi:hypothetical protein
MRDLSIRPKATRFDTGQRCKKSFRAGFNSSASTTKSFGWVMIIVCPTRPRRRTRATMRAQRADGYELDM